MISIGFCFALAPVARKLFKDSEKRSAFIDRHLSFFNAHPYFSSFALGAIAKVEHDLVLEAKDDYSKLDRLKNALIGPLGAIGDQLVWATIKPASILVGLLGVMFLPDFQAKIIFLVVLLALYNIPHIYIRIFGLIRGYRAGFEIYKLLSFENFKTVRIVYGGVGAVALGNIFSYALLESGQTEITHVIVFLICFFVAYYYRKWRQSVYRSLTLPVVLAFLLGIILENV
jgi:mannose/fructose/N-acetylgalactosamine-specific phosphotransferase system component IID